MTEVHVERDMPLGDLTHLEEAELLRDKQEELPSEYWLDSFAMTTRLNEQSRKLRWAKIKEDRLKLVSIHGTLILRFYSDLDDIESHMDASAREKEENGTLKKDVAFQWAQTIVHSCGREQLKQALPHFGEGNSDELRDYLEVVHYHEKEAEETYKKGHHRKRSGIGISPPVSKGHRRSISVDAGVPKNRKFFHASKSFGDGEDSSAMASSAKPRFRRSVSSGDGAVSNLGSFQEEITTKSGDAEVV
jgi:hypothetical protein